jgi:hypothetical protein
MNKLNFNLQMFSLDNFIPTVWSAQLLNSLKKSLVYGQPSIVNRNYEGDISAYGDTVKINSIGTVSVGDYTKNSNMSSPETLTDVTRTLTITESKYFNFQIDDIDKAQQNPKVMQQAMVEAAYALRNTADQFIASKYVDISNTIGSTASPDTFTAVSDAYDALIDLGVKLDEKNVPEEGRFVVVPAWYIGLLLKDDRFVGSGSEASSIRLLNGMVGEAGGLMVLKSNNVPIVNAADYKIIAGYQGAWTYAEQIMDVEAYRPELRFADAVKGLHLYGAKVTRPDGLACLTVTKPAL